MKKVIITLALLLPMVANAEDLLNVPIWEDFAPSTFVNVSEPKGIMKKLNVTAAYWYQRRVDFEKELSECEAVGDMQARAACYEKLKTSQYQQNSDYNARLEAQMNMNSGINEMNNPADNMLQLNNYINTFSRFQQNEISY